MLCALHPKIFVREENRRDQHACSFINLNVLSETISDNTIN